MNTTILGTLYWENGDKKDALVLSVSADFHDLSNERKLEIAKHLKGLAKTMNERLKKKGNRDND